MGLALAASPTQPPTTRRLQFASEEQRHAFEFGPTPMLMSGGWGSGKTWCGCMKGLWLSSRYQRNRGAVIRQHANDLRDTTRATWFKWCPPILYDPKRGGRSNDNNGYLRLADSLSEVLFIHLDDPETAGIIRGLEINWFMWDQSEENPEHGEELFDMLMARLGRWDVAEVPQVEIDRWTLKTGEPWPYLHPESGKAVPPAYPMLTCVEASTLVECIDGALVPISEACAESRRIRSLRLSDGADIFERPSVWQRRWVEQGVTIHTAAAAITATADHPCYRFNALSGLSVIRADELRPGDFVPGPARSVPQDETRLDPDLAYLLGYTVGDGNVATRRLQWTDTAADQPPRINRICKRLFGLRTSVHKLKGKAGWYFYLPAKSTVERLAREFPEIGIVGSAKKCVPVAIMRADSQTIANFLSGLFDADGTPGNGTPSHVSLTTVSRNLAQAVVLLLARLDIYSTLSQMPAHGNHQQAWAVNVTGAEAVIFEAVVGFRIDHKRGIAQAAGGRQQFSQRCVPLSRKSKGGPRLFQLHQLTAPRSKLEAHPEFDVAGALRFGWQRVKAVVPHQGAMEVYDITMPTAHNFVANGLLVHNCNPDVETHWLYRRFHPESEDHQRLYKAQGYHMFDMPSEGNAFLGEQNKQFLLSRDEAFIRRNVKGLWGQPEGAIHAIPKESLVQGTQEVISWIYRNCAFSRSLDHGDSAPTCCLWWAVDHEGNVICFQEYYQGNKPISFHRKNISGMSPHGMHYDQDLADPSIFHRFPIAKGGRTCVADEYAEVVSESRETALFWTPADNNEMGTRNRINEYLRVEPDRVHPFTREMGAPRLYFITRTEEWPTGVVHALRETRNQRRVKIGTELGKPLFSDERDPDITDHGYDCVRYEISSRPAVPPRQLPSAEGTFSGVLKMARQFRRQGRMR